MAGHAGELPEEEALKTRDGAIVWARVPGYPWWPATVLLDAPPVALKKRKRGSDYWVQFFNDALGAWLAPSSLRLLNKSNTELLIVRPGHRFRKDIDIALDQALAAKAAADSGALDEGGEYAELDIAAAAAAAAAAVATPSSSATPRSKSHTKKRPSSSSAAPAAAPLAAASPPSSGGRHGRASPPAGGAAGSIGGGKSPHTTPVTPHGAATGGEAGGDDGERPRKRSKPSSRGVAPAVTGGRGAEGVSHGGGEGVRRKEGPSRRALQSVLAATQKELSATRSRLAAVEAEAAARAAAAAGPTSWEAVKGVLKRFDLHGELSSGPPRGAPAAGGAPGGVDPAPQPAAENGQTPIDAGRGADEEATGGRYGVPKAERMAVVVSTKELKAAVGSISAAGKRLGAALAAAEQQRTSFHSALAAIPLRADDAPAAAAADGDEAAPNGPASPAAAPGGAGAGADGAPPPPSSGASGKVVPREVDEAAHLASFADRFREWAVLRAELNGAEAEMEAAVRRVIAMKVTLAQLSQSQAGKPVRVAFQRYHKQSPAVDALCATLIDQWMAFISQESRQEPVEAATPAPLTRPVLPAADAPSDAAVVKGEAVLVAPAAEVAPDAARAKPKAAAEGTPGASAKRATTAAANGATDAALTGGSAAVGGAPSPAKDPVPGAAVREGAAARASAKPPTPAPEAGGDLGGAGDTRVGSGSGAGPVVAAAPGGGPVGEDNAQGVAMVE